MTDRVGIVVVSHSAALADAVVALARQMVDDDPPPIAVAAGTDDGGLGTDATAVAAAIESVASPAGVLVVMDLGSAVLSAEMALEFLDDPDIPVRLTAAPLVEGVVAAVVQAALGADLDTVAHEAGQALAAKSDQLTDDQPQPVGHEPASDDATTPARADGGGEPDARAEVELVNADGLHARPAARVVATATRHAATTTLTNQTTGAGPADARSLSAVARLGARAGHVLVISATGTEARAVVDELVALVEDAFGEERILRDEGGGPTGAGGPRSSQGSSDASGASSRHDAPARPDWAGPARVTVRAAAPGRAVGPVVRMPDPVPTPPADSRIEDGERDQAIADIRTAAHDVAEHLRARAERVRGDAREILSAEAAMAEDPALVDEAVRRVREDRTDPAAAVAASAAVIADAFGAQGGYLAERRRDVEDVRDRLVAHLQGLPVREVPRRDEPFVLVADDLAPADMAVLDQTGCVALVTRTGGPTSHTAIIARAHGLPALVVGAMVDDLAEGMVVLVDATGGRLVVDPDEDRTTSADPPPLPTFDGAGRTADGHDVALVANVGGDDDLEPARQARAQGVGLLRTEFLFLDRDAAPSHDEQVETYRRLLAPFDGCRVVVRTLDAGSDKPLPFVGTTAEPNPALGVRGIRTAWARPDLLDVQLGAVAAAAADTGARVEVMAPLVASVDEAALFAAAADAHGLEYGIMVETPAAALMVDRLLDDVSFISVGTNDLAQYTMAADRLLGELGELNDPWQPAVLALAERAIAAAAGRGAPAGVCGEAAADPDLARVFVGMGATSLSMAPGAIRGVAAALAATTRNRCIDAAAAAVGAATASTARDAVRAMLAETA